MAPAPGSLSGDSELSAEMHSDVVSGIEAARALLSILATSESESDSLAQLRQRVASALETAQAQGVISTGSTSDLSGVSVDPLLEQVKARSLIEASLDQVGL